MKIANCKCGSVPEMGHAENFHGDVSFYWHYCEGETPCGIAGPARKTPEKALAAWNELMGQQGEPAAGSARKIVHFQYCAEAEFTLAGLYLLYDDGSMWWRCPGGGEPTPINYILPQPAEIKGSVE